MKPNQQEAATVQSNISGDTGQFTVDEDSLAHIMSVLTNLYADPELAVIREYLTNAYDAHIDAGMVVGVNWKPIEVTTPSHFNKSYIIRDYGIGMSISDLKNVYSKYGASTKRTSNKVVGMLGLGSKSALTYTNSFTITAVKDGRIAKAIVSFNEEGVPVFHVVHDAETTEPNGVEISIPVKDRNTFAKKTQNFVKYWPDGVVTIDGAEPVKHGYSKITDVKSSDAEGNSMDIEVFLVPTDGQGYYAETPKSYIVMGNVSYELDDEHIPSDLNALRVGFVAYVPIGGVTIVPSREKLYYNTRTKAVISDVGSGLADKIIEAKQQEIDNAVDHKQAWHVINNMSYEIRNTSHFRNGMEYKGNRFDSNLSLDQTRISWDYNGRSDEYTYRNLSYSSFMSDVEPLFVINSVFTAGAKKRVPTQMRRKARYYAEQNGFSDREVYFFEPNNDPDDPWIEHITRVEWADIEDIKIPRNPALAGTNKEVPYDFFRYVAEVPAKVHKKTGKELSPAIPATVTVTSELKSATKRRVYYISPADMQENRYKRGTTASELLRRFKDENIELAVMGSNRFDKFVRSHPGARHFKDYAQDYITMAANAIPDVHLVVEKFDGLEEDFCRAADPRAIDDPALADFVKAYQSSHDPKALEKIQTLTHYLRYANISVVIPESSTDVDPFLEYPLVRFIGNEYVEHLYTYINAQYAK